MKRVRADLKTLGRTENPPGVVRTTLSYNEQSMLCHFHLRKGAIVPLHHHAAVQSGYVVRGRVRFLLKGEDGFEAAANTSYVFDADEEHGAEALEDTEIIDCFTPARPEYCDN